MMVVGNKDSFLEYLKWRFPTLPLQYFDGQATFAFDVIDKDKYRQLFDLDAAVEKMKTPLSKVNTELRRSGIKYTDFAAAQVALALALTDPKARRTIVVSKRRKTAHCNT
jgi:hypothetical protein